MKIIARGCAFKHHNHLTDRKLDLCISPVMMVCKSRKKYQQHLFIDHILSKAEMELMDLISSA